MVLAQHAPGHITGLDLFSGFIDRFNANAAKLNLQDRVQGVVGSMDNLSFRNEELDLIWSEGAIRDREVLDGVLFRDRYDSELVCSNAESRIYSDSILPEECWTKQYFEPQIIVREEFLKKYIGNHAAEDFIAAQRHHAQLYFKYKALHGYAFYIGKKIEL